MSKGKHSTNSKKDNKVNYKDKSNKSKFSSLLKILLVIVIILIISFTVYYFIDNMNFFINNNNENIPNEVVYETSETVSVQESLTVKGADYLEIVGVYINSDQPKNSTVSTKIKNTSDKIHTDIELFIILMDKNNNKITSLNCKIEKLEPNEEILTYSSLAQDLSDCVNYSISLKK